MHHTMIWCHPNCIAIIYTLLLLLLLHHFFCFQAKRKSPITMRTNRYQEWLLLMNIYILTYQEERCSTKKNVRIEFNKRIPFSRHVKVIKNKNVERIKIKRSSLLCVCVCVCIFFCVILWEDIKSSTVATVISQVIFYILYLITLSTHNKF